MNLKKILVPGLVAGLAMLIVGMIVGMALNALLPSVAMEYENTNLFRPWSDPIMNIYYACPFILGIVLAWIWDKIKSVIPGAGFLARGTHLGLGYFALTISGILISYASHPISLAVIITWYISVLAQALVAGIVLAKMNP